MQLLALNTITHSSPSLSRLRRISSARASISDTCATRPAKGSSVVYTSKHRALLHVKVLNLKHCSC